LSVCSCPCGLNSASMRPGRVELMRWRTIAPVQGQGSNPRAAEFPSDTQRLHPECRGGASVAVSAGQTLSRQLIRLALLLPERSMDDGLLASISLAHHKTVSPRIRIARRWSLAAQARAVTASRQSRRIASPWLTRTDRSAARSWNRPLTIEPRTLLVTTGRNGHAYGPQLAVAYTMRLSTGCPCASKSPSHVMSRRARSWVGP